MVLAGFFQWHFLMIHTPECSNSNFSLHSHLHCDIMKSLNEHKSNVQKAAQWLSDNCWCCVRAALKESLKLRYELPNHTISERKQKLKCQRRARTLLQSRHHRVRPSYPVTSASYRLFSITEPRKLQLHLEYLKISIFINKLKRGTRSAGRYRCHLCHHCLKTRPLTLVYTLLGLRKFKRPKTQRRLTPRRFCFPA